LKPHLLAKRYARALFQLSERDQTSEKILAELQAVHDLLEKEPRIRTYFLSPEVDKKLKLDVVKKLLAKRGSPIFRNFMLLLVQKRRQQILPEILFEFNRFCDQRAGRMRATVISAVPVKPAQLKEVQTRLGRHLKAEVLCDNRVDPEIIGGLIVKVEGRVVDGSLRHQLEKLSRELRQVKYQTN